eukprot:6212437-Pleurochrysis_carterae.AAC.3
MGCECTGGTRAPRHLQNLTNYSGTAHLKRRSNKTNQTSCRVFNYESKMKHISHCTCVDALYIPEGAAMRGVPHFASRSRCQENTRIGTVSLRDFTSIQCFCRYTRLHELYRRRQKLYEQRPIWASAPLCASPLSVAARAALRIDSWRFWAAE